MISNAAIKNQFGKFSNYSLPQLRPGQILVIPGTKSSSHYELILDSVYDFNNILEDKVIVLCHRSDQLIPSEWILADCRNEHGTPVLTKVQKLTCRKNISHFIKKRQTQNFEKFKKHFLED